MHRPPRPNARYASSARRPRRSASLLGHEHGLSTLEYALLFILIVVGALLMWRKLGDSLTNKLDSGIERLDETLALASSPEPRHSDTRLFGSGQPSPLGSSPQGTSSPANTAASATRNVNANPASARGPHNAPGGDPTPAPNGGAQTTNSQPSTTSAASNIARREGAAPAPAPSAASHATAEQPEASWWQRTRDAVVSSTPVQMGLGIAYGTVQALAPGGFIAPSPAPSSRPFEFGRGAGETATGVVQIVTGVGMLGGGGTAAAAGAVGAPATGGGSLLVTGGGLAVAAEGLAAIAQGASNAAAGIITLSHAMSMQGGGNNGDGGDDGSGGSGGNGDGGGGDRTRPSGKPDPEAKPTGKRADPTGHDDEVRRSLMRENDSADVLARGGYKVEQQPSVPGSRNPDYRIEGRIFDNYAPKTSNARNIWSEINNSKLNPPNKARQADRIVLNLSDSAVEMAALKKQFSDWPMEGLKEVIVIKNGQIIPFWP